MGLFFSADTDTKQMKYCPVKSEYVQLDRNTLFGAYLKGLSFHDTQNYNNYIHNFSYLLIFRPLWVLFGEVKLVLAALTAKDKCLDRT